MASHSSRSRSDSSRASGPVIHFESPLAEAVFPAQHGGPVARGQFEHGGGGEGGTVAGRELVQLGAHVHFAEDVQIVVAGATVGAQADRHAVMEQAADGGVAAGEFHVAFRTVRDLDAAAAEEFDLPRGEFHAMGGPEARRQQAEPFQVPDRAHAVKLFHGRGFMGIFGQVKV